MINIMLFVGLCDEDKVEFTGIHNDMKTYFNEKGFIEEKSDKIITFTKENKIVVIEYLRIENQYKYIINILANYDFNKSNFIKEILMSENVYECIVLYDASSNKLTIDNYHKISKIEDYMKYYLADQIANIQGKCVFDIFENLKVKKYIGINYNNMITTLQSIELSEIINYMKDNPLGGNELSILKDLISATEEENISLINQENYIKEKFEKNIFDKFLRVINKKGINELMYEVRNRIAHNTCVEKDIFLKLMDDINELSDEIKDIICKNNNFSNKILDISIIFSSDYKIENIIMRLIECLDINFNNEILKRLIKNNNIEFEIDDDRQNIKFYDKVSGIKIEALKLKPELDIENNIVGEIYKLYIYFNENYLDTNLNSIVYNLLSDFTEKYIVLYDSISSYLRNKLYKRINLVENLVRLYIKLSEIIFKNEKDKKINKKIKIKNKVKMLLDMNALKINIEDNKIDLINNDLHKLDFIKLMDKLCNPLIEKDYADFTGKLADLDLDSFIKEIADLSSLDGNIESISLKWKKLYEIRTMVAHNFIIDKENFKEYLYLYDESSEEIKNAIYRLFTENLLEDKFRYEVILLNEYKAIIENYNKYFQINLEKNKNIRKIYRIEKYDLCRTINYLFNMKLNEYSIFFNEDVIDKFKNIESLENIELFINKILDENNIKYNEEVISDKNNKVLILERGISDLLKQIANNLEQ
ncbi:hypothetical protein GNF43_08630 [Clostridium perfringens]|uniref:Apea-like HEPN domain-containing protein n=1 Tax=Clostridium perfringens TaxID=1502 RepID=A0AAW9IQS9_CLOPF|nr:hypothetical protein [Clostridium perfringens]MDZ5003430.1 hypothetical protein [Clostridium perfringens]MDZ5008562.1 hypothetical protein [Clostridium perfringens]MDZ5056960.1 hypothetical protein [Clostridium perfringens]